MFEENWTRVGNVQRLSKLLSWGSLSWQLHKHLQCQCGELSIALYILVFVHFISISDIEYEMAILNVQAFFKELYRDPISNFFTLVN